MIQKWILKLIMLFALIAGTQSIFSQDQSVTGTISDENGERLIGVNIIIKGTTVGTISNVEGKYEIQVSSDAEVLVFSFIGMITQEIPIGDQTVIDLTMETDILGLEEIVVIGYGTVRKTDFTGSVAIVKGEELDDVTINSIQHALLGRAAGVQVSQGSSMPGGGISIRIRGSNSINSSNEPLYVVDGFPIMQNSGAIPSGNKGNTVTENPLASLNPSDIESIEILKDASSTAIYGSRGANGVILITTVRGKAGQSSISFQASYGMQQVARLYEVLNAEQFIKAANEEAINAGGEIPFPDNTPVAPYDPNTDTDWQNEIYRIAPVQQYQLSAQGGTQATRYALTAGYFNQQGVVKGSGFKRFSARLNGDQNLGKFNVGNSLLISRVINNRVETEGHNNQNAGPTNAALLYRPTLPVKNPDGSYTYASSHGSDVLQGGEQENPVASINEIENVLTKDDIIGNLFVTYEPISGLILKSSIGINISRSRRDYYATRLTHRGGRGSNGLGIIGRADVNSYLNENTVTYANTFGSHRINALGGYTIQKEIGQRSEMSNTQFPNDITKQNDIGAGTQEGGPDIWSSKSEWSMASWLGRLNYVFNDKYLATFTIRADGSSKFGKDKKWATFPSAAVAWRAGEENFMSNLGVFSRLKLRASWGITGNSEIGSYRSLARFGLQTYSFNENEQSAFYPNSISNPDLKWETTTQFDVGVDMGFWNNRLTLEADYYQKETEDGLINVTLPYNSGFDDAIMNLAKIENWGLEFTVRATPFSGEFRWDISANFSMNRNEVTDLAGIGPIWGANVSGDFKWSNATKVEEGYPMGVFYGYKYGGVFDDQADIDSWENGFQATGDNAAEPGDIKFYDTNGDGERTAADREIIGDPHPDFIAGITNNFSYKNFDLTIFLQGSYGNDVLNVNKEQLYSGGFSRNKAVERHENRWTPENTTAEWPRYGQSQDVSDNVVSWVIEDGSFLRVRSIVLGYNFPVNNLKWLQKARVYLSGDNLFLLTKYAGYDPDVNTMMGDGRNYTLGIDNGSYPGARVYKLGVNLIF